MSRGKKIALLVLLAALASPFVFGWWYAYGQIWYYTATFNLERAQVRLENAGWQGPPAQALLAHTGHPPVWMDGIEKFVVKLEASFIPPARQDLPHPTGTGLGQRLRAKGLWFAGTDADPRVQAALDRVSDCATTDGLGTNRLLVDPNPAHLFYSFVNVGVELVDGLGLIYNSSDNTLIYVHCDY